VTEKFLIFPILFRGQIKSGKQGGQNAFYQNVPNWTYSCRSCSRPPLFSALGQVVLGVRGRTKKQFQIAGRREEMNSSRFLLLLATVASVVVLGEAGFRCSIGEIFCKGSCVITLQDSGE
jgi:hypothetical protein